MYAVCFTVCCTVLCAACCCVYCACCGRVLIQVFPLRVFLRYKPHYVGPWVDTATQAPQVVILGTSHAEMYGSLLKRLAGILKDCALWEGTHELMR